MQKKLLSIIATAIFCCTFSSAHAQELPPFNGGTWAGDTIIHKGPIAGRGNGKNSPSRNQNITAVYYQEWVAIFTYPEVPFTVIVQDDDKLICLHQEITSFTTNPTLINLSTIPTGHYTLLLYINNECLEGEFEKE